MQEIMDSAIYREKFQQECTPGYYNNEGKPNALAIRNGTYGKGPIAYAQVLKDWRAEGSMKGLEVTAGTEGRKRQAA